MKITPPDVEKDVPFPVGEVFAVRKVIFPEALVINSFVENRVTEATEALHLNILQKVWLDLRC